MKMFCTSLRKKNNDFEKKKMLPLSKEELKLYQDPKVCYICGNRIIKMLKLKIIKMSEIIVLIQGNIEVKHIAFVI